MKKWGILLLAALGGIALVGCQQATTASVSNQQAWLNNTDCTQCHVSRTYANFNVNDVLGAKAGYENGGHLNGPRVFVAASGAGGAREFDGSDANYASGQGCNKCHTDQGFVDWATNGAPALTAAGTANTDPNASNTNTGVSLAPPGCFTCHDPHNKGNMNPRTLATVNLPIGFPTTTTNTSTSSVQFTNAAGGNGVLCANCHQARTAWAAPTTTYVKIASYWGPHHGPQTDFFLGVGSATTATVTTKTASYHAGVADTCVGCHMVQPTGNASSSLQVSGHGMYLTADVHGVPKDFIAVCQTCHTVPTATAVTGVKQSASTASSFVNLVSGSTMLFDIQIAEKTLVTYFGLGANCFTSTGTAAAAGSGAIVAANYDKTVAAPVTADFVPGNSWVQHLDWEFNPNSPYVSATQAKALWNFKLFCEDKSLGVHNPEFAAQLLYDAISTLGLTQPTNWTARP